MRRSLHQTLLAPAALVLAVLPAGCGGNDTSTQSEVPSSPTASSSTTSPVCSDLTDLKSSVRQLQNVTVAKGMGAELQTDLAGIEQDLKTLADDAEQQISPQVKALTSSLDALSAQLQSLQADPSTANLSAVREAIRSVGTAAEGVTSALSTTC